MLKQKIFNDITKFIYTISGLYFSDNKKYFVENKINQVMTEFNLLNMEDFLTKLLILKNEKLIKRFTDLLTVNETYFFRNKPQLDGFTFGVLPELLELKKKKGVNSIKIWSAGCSIGCEPYTLAMIVRERVPDLEKWDIKIIGSDISESALKIAKDGIYTEREVSKVPIDLKIKYFKYDNGYYVIKDIIKKMVSFEILNLADFVKHKNKSNIDVIFCRNVLIYFDAVMQKEIANSFYEVLNNKGYVFLGHSESMSRITRAFNIEKINKSFVYTKQYYR